MARIVVVSDNSALSLALATSDHDIVEVTAADAEPADADLFVVDLDDPIDAVAFLGDLHDGGTQTPSVVVIGDSPEWHSVQALDSGALAVVERPVSRPSLLAAVDHLLEDRSPDETVSTRSPGMPVPSQAPPGPEELPAPVPLVDAATTASEATSVRQPAGPRPAKPAKPPRARIRRRSASVAPAAPAPSVSTPPRGRRSLAESADEIVHEARRLQGLDIVACDLVGRAMASVDGSAGALLVRDGEVWRTAGGLALRPREWMAELGRESWLVDLVAHGQRAVIVEDTDIARQRLVNVPLARCRNLIIVPVTGVQGALLIARDEEPFNTDDLEAVIAAAADAEPDLSTAVLLRDVADTLQRFAERRSL